MRGDWLSGHAVDVAPRLLGAVLTSDAGGDQVAVRITEVEAYGGVAEDPGSHAYRRMTPRNATMFGRAGLAYVYFTYGMHFCMNVVCGEVGEPTAVLLRALEPLAGLEFMRAARATPSRPRPADTDLCSGPGKLCRALGIGRGENGTDLVQGGPMHIETGSRERRLANTARIGLSNAGMWERRLLRWYAAGSPHVSRP